MSASTHGTPASGYGTDLLRLICFEHIYGYTFPCTHQQGATRMTSTHPAGGATCWPNDVDADRHTNIHGAAYPPDPGPRGSYPVVIRARYRSSGRGPIGSRRWALRGVFIGGGALFLRMFLCALPSKTPAGGITRRKERDRSQARRHTYIYI